MSHPGELRAHHLFDIKYRLGDLRGSSVDGSVLLRLRPGPLLFTAPHSTAHFRAGRTKAAEFWTGALAESLAQLTGATALASLSPRTEAKNAASPDAFLDVLHLVLARGEIRLVIDLHGLGARHGIDVNIGAAGFPRPDAVAALRAQLEATYTVSVGEPYNGRDGITGLVNGTDATSAMAVQLELGPRLRSDTTPMTDLRRLAAAVSALAEAVHHGG